MISSNASEPQTVIGSGGLSTLRLRPLITTIVSLPHHREPPYYFIKLHMRRLAPGLPLSRFGDFFESAQVPEAPPNFFSQTSPSQRHFDQGTRRFPVNPLFMQIKAATVPHAECPTDRRSSD